MRSFVAPDGSAARWNLAGGTSRAIRHRAGDSIALACRLEVERLGRDHQLFDGHIATSFGRKGRAGVLEGHRAAELPGLHCLAGLVTERDDHLALSARPGTPRGVDPGPQILRVDD